MLEINTVYLGDCLDFMKQIPDKAVDLVLTDPPYGYRTKFPYGQDEEKEDQRQNRRGNKTYHGIRRIDYGSLEWDQIPEKKYFDEILRISKNAIIFGGIFFTDKLPPSSCWIVWDKDNTGDFADCELAWASFKTAVRKYKYRWNGLHQEDMAHKEKRVHPCQKPTRLFMKILEDYSDEGDIILDPFLGSGTTALAAIRTERKFIGIEKEEQYYNIALKRIKGATNTRLRDFGFADMRIN